MHYQKTLCQKHTVFHSRRRGLGGGAVSPVLRMRTFKYRHARTHTHAHTLTHTCSHSLSHTRTHSLTHTHTHTRARAYIHIHLAVQRYVRDTSSGNVQGIHPQKPLAPEDYATQILASAFTLCPRNQRVETSRMYEALEGGSIPVMELTGTTVRGHLPPFFRTAPFLYVRSWEDASAAMWQLWQDKAALLERQAAAQRWYTALMSTVAHRLEEVVESRR